MSTDAGKRPLLRVIRGEPSPEEIAAFTTVVLTLVARGGAGSPPVARRSAWAARSALMRSASQPGHGAWRASALPRQ